MKDLYNHLQISPDADDATIRQALSTAAPPLRTDAEGVLLSPRRRQSYDRNRKLLHTIAELRLHLGLTYTRFWTRSELREFWQQPTSVAPKPGRQVDSMLIAGAFRGTDRRLRRHMSKQRNWIIAVGLVVVAGLGIWLWAHFR
jgi:hypothetical protein